MHGTQLKGKSLLLTRDAKRRVMESASGKIRGTLKDPLRFKSEKKEMQERFLAEESRRKVRKNMVC